MGVKPTIRNASVSQPKMIRPVPKAPYHWTWADVSGPSSSARRFMRIQPPQFADPGHHDRGRDQQDRATDVGLWRKSAYRTCPPSN